ncbi:DnaJ-class molecular chaperone CbpA [Klebsiella pneumoniae]|uniref:DnaJ-class molecular chaperone CbpA n=1 Tax=Klebsiella pneumoniae TaxID=573 RepID=A0A447RXC4_KLEPN|nr:DnaJ-class molecular chaperone CbpA [Klebsiella pneumoniae]
MPFSGCKPTDDLKTIKTAYRRLARKYHPDVSKETMPKPN